MNRYFISDKESDILITVATKVFGLKIGDIINMAIKNEFLPMTEPFRTEATFILQPMQKISWMRGKSSSQ